MKNSSYWKKRFEILEESAVKKGADYYESLDKEYRKAQKAIDAKINVWYQRFANNNNISLADARKFLNSEELEELKWSVEDYIKHGQENAFTQEWMKELENASAKVHISRLESLKLQIQQEIEMLYGNQLDGIDKLARDIYTDGYYRTAFEIQKGFNVGWDFHSIDSRRLEKVISKPWAADGKTFSDKLWTQKNDLISTLHTELTQGIMRGLAPDKAIQTISNKFKVAKSKAGRLVMTESAYFASASQKDCFNELGVEKFEIVATLDSHTSELCRSLDGKVQDMKDFQPGVTAPPFHPWCRTTTVPYFDDDFGERAARGADGKTYYVPSDMKYSEWKEKFVVNETESERYTREDYENIGKAKVDFSIFDSKKWNDNFDSISDNSKVNSSIKRISEQMLKHRSGTFYEDLYFIDANTGKIAGFNTSDNKKLGVTVNEKIRNALDNQNITLIGIHNHPYSSLPSLSDLNAIAKRSNQSMGVIVCHDGTIFTYSKPFSEIKEFDYKMGLTKFKKYSKITNENKGMEYLSNLYEFEFRRFEP